MHRRMLVDDRKLAILITMLSLTDGGEIIFRL
jgi:hypothetical protein